MRELMRLDEGHVVAVEDELVLTLESYCTVTQEYTEEGEAQAHQYLDEAYKLAVILSVIR